MPGRFEEFDNPEALFEMAKTRLKTFVERRLARMAKRRMAEIVTQRNRFHQVLIQKKRPRRRARNLRHFQRMGKPRSKMVPFRRKENLRLPLQPPKRLAVKNAIPIPLLRRSVRVFLLRAAPPLRVPRKCGIRRKLLPLPGLQPLPHKLRTPRPRHETAHIHPFSSAAALGSSECASRNLAGDASLFQTTRSHPIRSVYLASERDRSDMCPFGAVSTPAYPKHRFSREWHRTSCSTGTR